MDYTSSPIRDLIIQLLDERYEGVTFSPEIIEAIEGKVAPAIRIQAEETVIEFVADFFSSKKPVRKPRRPKAKKASVLNETAGTNDHAIIPPDINESISSQDEDLSQSPKSPTPPSL